jgi:Flp pilus assembly protein TadD
VFISGSKNNTLSGVGGFLNPEVEEYLRKGHIYRKNGQLSQAFRSYCRALKLEPKSPVIWNNIGAIFYLSGDQSLAISCTRRALLLNPKYYNAKTNLETIEESLTTHSKSLRTKPRIVNSLF